MIWVRRIFGVPLGIALLLLLFASLILLRLNDTFLNADFYPERLERADVYQFVMVDVLTLVMDEARKLDPKEFGAGFDGTFRRASHRSVRTGHAPDRSRGESCHDPRRP